MFTSAAQLVLGPDRFRHLFLFSVLLLGAVSWCPWRLGVVSGCSMVPTLQPGAFFCYDRSYYQRHTVCVGDVVVVRHAGEVWIKRVYAVGGDCFWAVTAQAESGLTHNPIRQDQRDQFRRMFALRHRTTGTANRFVRLRLPKETLFLVGDASSSWDSRHFGPVDAGEVLGRVVTPKLPSWPAWVEWCFPIAGSEKEAGSAA